MPSDLQRATDQEFFERARRRSPVYPSVAEALERRIRYREKIAARVMIVGTFTGAVCSFWNPLGFAAAGFSLVGLAATCLYAGNRQYRRSEGRRRPF